MKFRRELSLTRKLILVMMATSVAALLVACIFFLSYDFITLRNDTVDHLRSLAGITGANVAAALTFNDPKSADLVLQALQSEPHIVAARIYDGRGQAFVSYYRISGSLAPLPRVSPAHGSQLRRDDVTECDPIVFDGESIGSVYLVSDLQEIMGRMRRFVVFVLILMAASSAAGFIVAVLLKRIISRRSWTWWKPPRLFLRRRTSISAHPSMRTMKWAFWWTVSMKCWQKSNLQRPPFEPRTRSRSSLLIPFLPS